MLVQDALIDLIIPRGGEAFVRWVSERSRVPVLKHDKGLVHVYVDAAADLDMATSIVVNAKANRPSVCNALETLLVDRAVADRFLPMAAARLTEAGVELRGCPETLARVPGARPATESDWDEEYGDLILAIRVVDGFDAAVDHIRRARHRAGRGDRHQRPAAARAGSRARSTPPPCSSTPPRAWSTATSSASAPRWASRPRAFTRAVRWACAS